MWSFASQENDLANDKIDPSTKRVNMFSYVAEGSLQMWLQVRGHELGSNPGLQGEPNLMAGPQKERLSCLTSERGVCRDGRAKNAM